MKIHCNDENLEAELLLVYNLFSNTITGDIDKNLALIDNIYVKYHFNEEDIVVNIRIDFLDNSSTSAHTFHCPDRSSKYIRRYTKLGLFDALSAISHQVLEWGSITGIRPTKLYYELLETHSESEVEDILVNLFKISPKKVSILSQVVKSQAGVTKSDTEIDLYVNIPFCTTKCAYCSFISSPIAACKALVAPYCDALIHEIEAVKKIIAENNYTVRTIYVGGGTPTAIPCDMLDRILSHLDMPVKEFTVEAGRPDTITKETLDVLLKNKVTRISINPQTFCDRTLKIIGRSHTVEDFYRAYNLALNYPFIINMDLIAGLEGETLDDFCHSVNCTLACSPANITIHTLSIKRRSDLIDKSFAHDAKTVSAMVDFGYNKLTEAGYVPYYLYRQKNMIGNLENIGYTKPGYRCISNIDSMEEILGVIAVGANAVSKKYTVSTNRIDRLPNVRDIKTYIDRVDEMISKKAELFKK